MHFVRCFTLLRVILPSGGLIRDTSSTASGPPSPAGEGKNSVEGGFRFPIEPVFAFPSEGKVLNEVKRMRWGVI